MRHSVCVDCRTSLHNRNLFAFRSVGGVHPLRTAPLLICIFFLLALLCESCDQAFDGQSPFENRLVIYSLLSTDQNQQFVRLYTNYDVQGFDPSQNTVDHAPTGAQVSVMGPEASYAFRDTLLGRPDTSRYKDPINAYVAAPFQVIPGNTYSLSVVSQGFDRMSAVVKVPGRSEVTTVQISQFDDPHPGDPRDPLKIVVQAYVSPVSKGCLTQMFVDYDVLTEVGWKPGRVEIPMFMLTGDTTVYMSTFPKLERITSSPVITTYYVTAYMMTLSRVKNAHPNTGLLFRRVVLRALQVESNLYDYYNVVNGFRDPASIRIDEPDYSNIRGAYGLFGAYTLDSLVHPLPSIFSFDQ